MISKISNFKPDFIFSIDHVGLTPKLLKEIKIPCISWFIDNPFHLYLNQIGDLDKGYLRNCIIFSWDKTYLEPLKRFGFERVFYLPMAANPKIFRYI